MITYRCLKHEFIESSDCPVCLRKENELLRMCHESELGVCQEHCDVVKGLTEIKNQAQNLFDNRLGWSDGRNPYAPPEFWTKLEQALNEINPDYEQARADQQ